MVNMTINEELTLHISIEVFKDCFADKISENLLALTISNEI